MEVEAGFWLFVLCSDAAEGCNIVELEAEGLLTLPHQHSGEKIESSVVR